MNYIKSMGNGDSFEYEFRQVMQHPIIDWIQFNWDTGLCHVYYKSGEVIDCMTSFNGYNRQYGAGISNDGERIYIGHWYARQGLCCYDVKKNELLWKLNSPKNRNIYVYDGYIIVVKAGISLSKINEYTGEIIDEQKSSTINTAFYIRDSYLLVETLKGKLTLFDVKRMNAVKSYRYPVMVQSRISPLPIMSPLLINKAIYSTGVLSVCGLCDDPFRKDPGDGDLDPHIIPIDTSIDEVIQKYEAENS